MEDPEAGEGRSVILQAVVCIRIAEDDAWAQRYTIIASNAAGMASRPAELQVDRKHDQAWLCDRQVLM